MNRAQKRTLTRLTHYPAPAADPAFRSAFKTAPVEASKGSSPETTRSAYCLVGKTNR
jgi:hypothetical protein